ncbi:oxidoreductase [Derxia gummosa]|uniref:Oxidoreductase n=1 Tax=Derxia gummosa DSM 723 TaxID=1121388 RepID=A0A8B6X621_9BURK|nr:oxidoreductase [Derxia gummosa]
MSIPLRCALLGYGYAGKTFHAPLIAAEPGLQLAAVLSSDAARVHADFAGMPVTRDADALFADPALDLVVIDTPNDLHAPLARAALLAGKHVVVDKPFTLTLAEARELAALAAAHGLVLSVFQNRRFDGDFLALRELLAAGTLGQLVQLDSHFDRFRPEVRDRWRERDIPGGGLWYDLAPHLLDQTLCLFGLPASITARIATLRPGGAACDWWQARLDYGAHQVCLQASMIAAGPMQRFAAFGTAGAWFKSGLDMQEDRLRAGGGPRDAGFGLDTIAPRLHLGDDAVGTAQPEPVGDYARYYAGIAQAVAAMKAGDAARAAALNPVRPAEAVALMALLEAGLQSSAEGRVIVPALTDAERAALG